MDILNIFDLIDIHVCSVLKSGPRGRMTIFNLEALQAGASKPNNFRPQRLRRAADFGKTASTRPSWQLCGSASIKKKFNKTKKPYNLSIDSTPLSRHSLFVHTSRWPYLSSQTSPLPLSALPLSPQKQLAGSLSLSLF